MTEFGLKEETVMREMRLSYKIDFQRDFKEEKETNKVDSKNL